MSFFAITKTDGSVSIMQTVSTLLGYVDGKEFWEKLPPESCIEKWADAEQARVVSISEIDPLTIPADRTYRDAWTLGPDGIDHRMDRARDIHRALLRVARTPLLAALDVEYQRADESGDATAKTHIARKKQALRDVTAKPEIDRAATVDELKRVTI